MVKLTDDAALMMITMIIVMIEIIFKLAMKITKQRCSNCRPTYIRPIAQIGNHLIYQSDIAMFTELFCIVKQQYKLKFYLHCSVAMYTKHSLTP